MGTRETTAWIIVNGPGFDGRRFGFSGDDLLVGRDATCSIRLDHPSVSRLHARIYAGDEGLSIEDLKSTHGTFCDSKRVTTQVLDAKEPVNVGPFQITADVLQPIAKPARPASMPADATDPRAKLSALLSIVEAFDPRASKTACLGQLLDSLLSAVAAERGFLYRVDAKGTSATRVFERATNDADIAVPVSETLILKAARELRPLWLVEMEVADSNATLPPGTTGSKKSAAERLAAMAGQDWDASVHRLAKENLQSVIVCPLAAGQKLSGVLWLDSRVRMKSFARGDADLVEAVSRSAAQLLDGLDVREELATENRRLRQQVDEAQGASVPVDKLVAKDSPVKDTLKLCQRAARAQDVTVLLSGETGTGKEVLARYIHEISNRKDGPFVAVNCGALPEGLLESELFGHKKGAFTGATDNRAGLLEMSSGGTLFLDEVGELSLSSQVKLLRVLQERTVVRVGESEARPVDFRLIAATLRDLSEMVARKAFREDLFYRLNVLGIKTIPLRERKMDLQLIVDFNLRHLAPRVGSPVRGADPQVIAALQRYSWPGNLRELRNVIERALVVEEGEVLSLASLPNEVRAGAAASLSGPVEAPVSATASRPIAVPNVASNPGSGGSYADALDTFEREYFQRLIAELGLNVSALARRARLTRFTIYRKLAHLGLREGGEPEPGESEG
jgi:transcriptional regulator with GAF, ATPase, and Fis domain